MAREERLYDSSLYRFEQPVSSWWEASAPPRQYSPNPLKGSESCDVVIIGGGYTGLSTAYHLCREGQTDVRVLEAGHIGWGASGRNGGFCSVGGEKIGPEAIEKKYGAASTRHFYQSLADAVQLVREILAEESIEAEPQGDQELAIACSSKGFEHLKDYAALQRHKFGFNTAAYTAADFRERFFDSPRLHGGVTLSPTFGLHPLRYVRGLADAVERYGGQIHEHSEVLSWTKEGGVHVLRTSGGNIHARRVVIAGNGFMPEHLKDALFGRPLPIISAIVTTRAMRPEELAMQKWRTESPAFTAVNLLNYFRVLPDGRMLFGGRGSATGDARSTSKNFTALEQQFRDTFPAWHDVDIDYRWHGLICMTRRGTPAIGRLNEDASVWFAFGYHGNGVSTSTWSGKQVAKWISSGREKAPESIPVPMLGMPNRFPLAKFRLKYIAALISILRIADRLS